MTAQPNPAPLVAPGSDYILVTIVNTSRASAVRALALEFCPAVVIVRDGDDAVRHMDQAGPPRLLITELSLPGVDGFGVLRHLRHLAPAAKAAAIVISPHERFRNAAQKLSESLAISKVLPLEADRAPLRRAIAAVVHAQGATPVALRPTPIIAPPAAEPTAVEDAMARALVDLTRRFRLPLGAGYLHTRGERRFSLYATGLDASTPLDWPRLSELLPVAAASEDPLVVPDLKDHPLLGDGPARLSPVRGFAAAPLLSGTERPWGAIGVFDLKPLTLTSADVDDLAAFARDVADRIEACGGLPANAAAPAERDLQALEQLAATDPLTGLANRRGCEKSITGEISRAERERKPLSCIMLDIDRFKQINDTLGHQAGDHVLRELSALLRQSVRAYDIVARWGGEEFLIVLPGANLEAARLLAERIRLGAQRLRTIATGGVTVSAGVAEFGMDYDFETTLRAADRRMYEAKSAGRNCVV